MDQRNRFNLVTSGYDVYQVDNEIDRLEYRIQEQNERILLLQNQIETVNNQFNMIKKRYQMLVNELSAREKQADDVSRLALKEANSIINDAQKNADNIVQEAILQVQGYVDELNQHKETAKASNQAVREAINQLVDVLNANDAIEVPDPFKVEEPKEVQE